MRKGCVVVKCSGLYEVTPQSVPMMKVNAKPRSTSDLHALCQTIARIPALSSA